MSKREAKPGDIWACRDRSRIVLVTSDDSVVMLFTTGGQYGIIRPLDYMSICVDYVGTLTDLDWDFWRRTLPK